MTLVQDQTAHDRDEVLGARTAPATADRSGR
jgi:hypothetical protein